MTESTDGDMALEVRLDRLEEIARAMEGDELTLDQAMSLFEEAVGHLRAVEQGLREAQVRVDELIGRGDSATLRPIETDQS